VSLAITSAVAQAVSNETRRIAKQQSESGVVAPESREPSPNAYRISESATVKDAGSSVSPKPSAGGNPPSIMLTEDGETMLHPSESLVRFSCIMGYSHRCPYIPAELLTQVGDLIQ
jgi:hypothetical protein